MRLALSAMTGCSPNRLIGDLRPPTSEDVE
jgi:hypothetical protein